MLYFLKIRFLFNSNNSHELIILQLVAILREVKYLENAENETLENIPDSATSVYSRNEEFHKYCANLDLVVAWYNKIRQTLLDVEFPLVETRLQNIDKHLERAEKDLNWNSAGIFGIYILNFSIFFNLFCCQLV